MQRLETDAGSPGPWWGKEEQTESVNVPLMTGIVVSHKYGILAYGGNSFSYVQTDGSSNMSSALVG